MKKQILNLLKYTEKEYDMLVFDLFYQWCNSQAFSTKHLQMLVTNQALYVWFMRAYTKNEKRFLDYSVMYKGVSNITNEMRDLYDKTTVEINFYPKALLNEINRKAKKGFRITNKQFQSNLN